MQEKIKMEAMMDDFNGLEFGDMDTTGGGMAKIVLIGMVVLFAFASALTTFSFFATYAPGIGSMFGEWGWIVAGLSGVLLLDIAGFAWSYVRSRNATTTTQFNIATIAAGSTIISSVVVSFLYVLLSANLETGITAADGTLTSFGTGLNALGVLIMSMAFAGNFAMVAAYVNTSAATTKSVQNTQLSAYLLAGQFAADRQRAQLVVNSTLRNIANQLPELARSAGASNAENYTNAHFGRSNPQVLSAPQPLPYATGGGGYDEAEAMAATVIPDPMAGAGAGQRTVVVEAANQAEAIERLRQLGYYDQNDKPSSVRRVASAPRLEEVPPVGGGFR
jgi:hypothetical protein